MKYWKEKYETMLGKGDTNTFIHSGIDNDPLPNDSAIRFKLKSGYIEARISKDDSVTIHCNTDNHKKKLFVKPLVSNSIDLEFKDE